MLAEIKESKKRMQDVTFSEPVPELKHRTKFEIWQLPALKLP